MTFKILNIESGREQIFHSKDGGGIGCLDIHPSRKFFAVGEKGTQPNIYIYSYPEIEVVKVLEGGTEKNYACISFSK